MDFTGKVVLLTGASSGIGATSAKELAGFNATLALVGRNVERLNAVAKCCQERNGLEPLTINLDLTEEGNCEEAIKRTINKFGKLNVLINCAGKLVLNSLFDENILSFDDLYKINLRVPYQLMHLALPHLTKTKGNVILVAAGQSDVCLPGFLGYSIFNTAVERLVKAAAVDMSTVGVKVNAISVSLVKTNALQNLNLSNEESEMVYSELEKQRLIKALDPYDVAKMIIFVASGVFPSINGSNIYVNNSATFMM
ncbi:uncharacterized protein LOC114356428 [Ostrinia furnacalis]|uniref:uncharacterized protein LOC114356428 n=1 Tax=Ostrinia furnacalis TaxID=93504 RepID=UPI00103A3A1E|nr:uncharacterized protein LOC114356428 [Ostrinia furnacalis]